MCVCVCVCVVLCRVALCSIMLILHCHPECISTSSVFCFLSLLDKLLEQEMSTVWLRFSLKLYAITITEKSRIDCTIYNSLTLVITLSPIRMMLYQVKINLS